MNITGEEKIKKISIREFREFGFLHELNRLFLHPLGMALEVVINEDGTEELGGIWDYREDKEGILYNVIDDDGVKKIKRVREFKMRKHEEKFEALGYVVQPASLARP